MMEMNGTNETLDARVAKIRAFVLTAAAQGTFESDLTDCVVVASHMETCCDFCELTIVVNIHCRTCMRQCCCCCPTCFAAPHSWHQCTVCRHQIHWVSCLLNVWRSQQHPLVRQEHTLTAAPSLVRCVRAKTLPRSDDRTLEQCTAWKKRKVFLFCFSDPVKSDKLLGSRHATTVEV